jgi:hypothetical protein
MGFLDPFGPFLAHFDPLGALWSPLLMIIFSPDKMKVSLEGNEKKAEGECRRRPAEERGIWENTIIYPFLHVSEMSCDPGENGFFS